MGSAIGLRGPVAGVSGGRREAVWLGARGLALERLAPEEWVTRPEIFVTGMLVFLSYEGIERIANASPRLRSAARNLPRAFAAPFR